MFKWREVSSSVIEKVGYDASRRTLRIVFLKDSTYDYRNVDGVEFDLLCNADSVGKYYSEYIRGHYNELKVLDEPFDDEDLEESKMVIYEVYENSDLTEGKGSHVVVGRFTHRPIAEHVLKTKARGVFGSTQGKGIKEVEVCTATDLEQYKRSLQEDVRKRALSKLTAEEILALGL